MAIVMNDTKAEKEYATILEAGKINSHPLKNN
jgi:hypothetical protein